MKKILKECPLIIGVCISTVILVATCFFSEKVSNFFPKFMDSKEAEEIEEYVEELFFEDETEDAADTDTTPEEEEVINEDNEPKVPSYKEEPVTIDYFDDALFIGDSRTVGLSEYSGWDNTTFYADIGMTIYDIFEREVKPDGQTEMTIGQALHEYSFKKIYLMIGINELGRGNDEEFTEEFKLVLLQLKILQPDAIIILQGIMHVSDEKSAAEDYINNPNIINRNLAISELADGETVFYLDMNDTVCNENGALIPEYTFDGVHLRAQYYYLWTDYLLEHGISEMD